MGEDTRFDELLLNVAAQSGGIEPLLKSFFSFLHRKTDFYVVADFQSGAKVSMGFPPGGAEKIVSDGGRNLSPAFVSPETPDVPAPCRIFRSSLYSS
jgi:hypothetical protein